MATTVKGNPSDKGAGGQARTRLARRAVIDAARALFLERGYQATTIEAISDRSDVPPATVYRLFSSKLGILKALLDVSIAGDDQARPLQERPDVAALFAEPDPDQLMATFARLTVAINTRSGDIYRILSSASNSDPAARAGSHARWHAPERCVPGYANATRRTSSTPLRRLSSTGCLSATAAGRSSVTKSGSRASSSTS